MFNDLDKKSSNIYNFTIKILESGKLFFQFLLTKVEQIVARVKNQIEIEKYKWELKKKYVDLGKYISDKKITKSSTDFSHDNYFLEIVNEINRIKIYIEELRKLNDNKISRLVDEHGL